MDYIYIAGRRISIMAILAVFLVMGVASAAVFTHYATLTGTSTVTNDVYVEGIPIGGEGELVFIDGMAGFSIGNNGNDTATVQLITTIYEGEGENIFEITDPAYLQYLDVEYVVDETIISGGVVTVTPGGVDVSVEFDPSNNVEGVYTIQVEVTPYTG